MRKHIYSLEQDLLRQLAEGDEYAFEQLYLLYSPRIYKKILLLVKQVDLAEELLQDVFVKIWEKRNTIDSQKSFKSYVYIIAKNVVIDLFRKATLDRKIIEKFIVENPVVYDPFEKMYDSDLEVKSILNKALDSLPPQRKKIFTLVKIEGMSYDEVSDLLQVSTSTINDHVVKANKSLKKYFENNNVALIALTAYMLTSF